MLNIASPHLVSLAGRQKPLRRAVHVVLGNELLPEGSRPPAWFAFDEPPPRVLRRAEKPNDKLIVSRAVFDIAAENNEFDPEKLVVMAEQRLTPHLGWKFP